jgi:peptidoglycan/xylan/chitin deacetylase (PgdA/CDA1 family)
MTHVWRPSSEHPRDFVGYGRKRPDPRWPGNARIAVNFAINYEEGSEYSITDGSGRTELGLAEAPGGRVPAGQRDLAFETMYEYGSRVGIWRVFDLFQERQLPATVFGCAVALERNPQVAEAIAADRRHRRIALEKLAAGNREPTGPRDGALLTGAIRRDTGARVHLTV